MTQTCELLSRSGAELRGAAWADVLALVPLGSPRRMQRYEDEHCGTCLLQTDWVRSVASEKRVAEDEVDTVTAGVGTPPDGLWSSGVARTT
ncbi:hypothetical protein NDU88_004645 [Pleurodeles waltl]|uniref:Uncharacterized protein n=1 Tax=Pleurodeles waltl TaxID=8319 RepID=A0AAV7W9I4_PLEWA|nr:hypothetical protein NDU88_004645 [Pleurodeles waltl]